MRPYTYLLIDLACIAIPFVFSFYKKHAFYKQWKYFIPANIIVAILFLVWDFWFTKIGVWGFNPDYLTGIYLFNLPIEEVLFFFCIPYACVFTYFSFKWLFPKINNISANNIFTIIILIITLISTIILYDKIYSFLTASLLSAVLLYTLIKKININLIILAYLAIIPFFFLSNGVLTGSFIQDPIVWYNNNENSTVRMFTIPIEDTFYGFLLILCNVLIYERLKSSAQKNKNT